MTPLIKDVSKDIMTVLVSFRYGGKLD